MNIDTAIVRIIDGWDGWQAEAGQQAQMEQDPRAGEVVMKRHLRDVLEKLMTAEHGGYCHECEGCGWVQVYSPCPPAFGVCQVCFNPDDNPSP